LAGCLGRNFRATLKEKLSLPPSGGLGCYYPLAAIKAVTPVLRPLVRFAPQHCCGKGAKPVTFSLKPQCASAWHPGRHPDLPAGARRQEAAHPGRDIEHANITGPAVSAGDGGIVIRQLPIGPMARLVEDVAWPRAMRAPIPPAATSAAAMPMLLRVFRQADAQRLHDARAMFG
jgi:hypothetical protein